MTRDEASKILGRYGFHLRRREDLYTVKISTPLGRKHIVACQTIKEVVSEAIKLAKVLNIQRKI